MWDNRPGYARRTVEGGGPHVFLRESKSPPCRQNRDKGGATGNILATEEDAEGFGFVD